MLVTVDIPDDEAQAIADGVAFRPEIINVLEWKLPVHRGVAKFKQAVANAVNGVVDTEFETEEEEVKDRYEETCGSKTCRTEMDKLRAHETALRDDLAVMHDRVQELEDENMNLIAMENDREDYLASSESDV